MELHEVESYFFSDLDLFFTFTDLLTQDEVRAAKLLEDVLAIFLCTKISELMGQELFKITILSLIYSTYKNQPIKQNRRVEHIHPQADIFYKMSLDERAVFYLKDECKFSIHQIGAIVAKDAQEVQVIYEKNQADLMNYFMTELRSHEC